MDSAARDRDRGWALVLDQGGHATRAVVFDAAGALMAQSEAAIETQHPASGRVEHDPENVLASVTACVNDMAAGLGTQIDRIAVASLCTQRSSLVCWSKSSGTALSPVLSWQDVRAGELLERCCPDESTVRSITGLRPSEHYGASKMRWCLDNLPAVQAARTNGDLAVGPLASFLLFRLSGGGAFAVDPCNASRTLLWDMHRRDWSAELLNAFGIPRDVLPQCRGNRSDWLRLRIGAHAVPLAIVTGDQSAVPFAFASSRGGRVFLTLGTGAFLQQPETGELAPCERLLNSVILQDGDEVRYALEGTVNGAGSALRWFAEDHAISESELLERLPGWLAEVTSPLLFLNAVGGLAAPFWRPRAYSRFNAAGDVPAKAVAVVESIAFLLQANVDAMRVCGRRVDDIVVVGGLSRLDGLLRRIAILAQAPVHRARSL
ncbi:MAG: FGGY family carbohydrate kinase, partial [Burkholderiales bacterium]